LKFSASFRPLICTLLLSTLSFAASITGTVTNKTTNKSSSGDDVVLVKLAATMEEEARTKSDAKGHFTLNLKDASATHLVRVTHQGVNYFRPAPPGTTSVEAEVYDAAKEVEGVRGLADITRVQADGNRMDVLEMWIVSNDSKPPRTKMSERSFEIVLPEGAAIDASLAAGPGGMPVTSAPVPTGEKGHYAVIFPIRPGETRFQISYHLPYSGSFSFTRQPTLAMDDVVVMLPKSMEFKTNGNEFQATMDEKGMRVYVAKNVSASQKLAFSIAGTGQIPREAQGPEGDQSASANAGGADNRPGGGMAPPIDAPDPLHKYRWWLLGGLAAALVAGAFYMMGRPAAPPQPATVARIAHTGSPELLARSAGPRGSNSLLETLKEELFQLESERLQGHIAQTEYDQAKAALDLIIKRALARQSSAKT
jgi:hypothetical protein